MPALRVDWQAIRGALADVNAPYVFVLPDGARQLFLAIADQLSWEATYRAFGYDYSDWDALQKVHAHGVAGLLGGIPLDELISHIDDIEPLLTAIRDRECCPDDGWIADQLTDPDGIIGVEDNPVGEEIDWGTGDPPGGEEDWPAATLERCAQAENFAANLHRWIGASQALQEVGEGLSVVLFVAALAAFLPTIGVAVIAGAVTYGAAIGLFNLLQLALDAGPDFAAARAELQDSVVIGRIVCAIITSDTAAEAESAVDAALASNAPNAAPMIAALPLRYLMGSIFNLDGSAGGFGGSCRDCSCAEYSLQYGGMQVDGLTITIDSASITDRERVAVRFNYDGAAYCGGMRTISNASLIGAGTASRVLAQDQSGNAIVDQGSTSSCGVSPSILNGVTCARVYVDRMNSCGNQFFDLVLTMEPA